MSGRPCANVALAHGADKGRGLCEPLWRSLMLVAEPVRRPGPGAMRRDGVIAT